MPILTKFLDETCKRNPKLPALMWNSDNGITEISYANLKKQILSQAKFLQEKGVQKGDRVAFLTAKSPEQFRLFYACWMIGAVAVPVCEALGDLETAFIIRDADPKVTITSDQFREKAEENIGDIPVYTFSELPLNSSLDENNFTKCSEDDLAALIYTSGSTGMPKGVMLTHKNITTNALSVLDHGLDVTEKDSVISLLPYWHCYALVVEVVLVIKIGGKVIIPKDKRDFKRNIKNYQPTILLVVPRIINALKTGIQKKIHESSESIQKLFNKAIHNASRIYTPGPVQQGGFFRLVSHHTFFDPIVFRKIRASFGGKLRFLISGGAPLDLEHQIFFKYIGLPVYQGYGLTEATPVISTNYPEEHKLGTCGPLLPWVLPENGGDYTFKDEKGNLGKELHGELLVKGDCVMKGYWRHADQSAKTLSEGWLHTGDMGYMDDKYLVLDGRQGNMIVLIGGEKLHPEHVEDAIKNSEIITEAMLIGEKCKNVYACINIDSEWAEGKSENEIHSEVLEEVKQHTDHLAAYQKPKEILFLPEFTTDDSTLTVTLKIRRHKVFKLYQEQIETFLKENGEEVAIKKAHIVPNSRIMENLSRGRDEE